MKKQTTKKIILSFSLFLAIIMPVLFIHSLASAQVIEPQDFLRTVGEKTGLPGFETAAHGQAAVEPGASEITSAIYAVIDFVKYILGSIAVFMIVLSGIKMVTARGDEVQEVLEKEKKTMKYGLSGLIVVILADILVKQVFFGEYGEAFRTEAEAIEFAKKGAAQIKGLYNFLEIFVASIAVLSIIKSGIAIITSGGAEEKITKEKKRIGYAVLGLLLIGVAEFAVKDIIFPEAGKKLTNVDKAKTLVLGLTNFIAAFVSTFSLIGMIYAGYLYVIGVTSEENVGKAKKALFGSVIALLIAGGAYALVNTLIEFKPEVGDPSAIEELPGFEKTPAPKVP